MPLVKPMARTDLVKVELDGEAVIYDEDSTDLHHLNPTATIVFGLCDGRFTMREISTEIAEAFDVPIEQVEPEVRTLVRRFRQAKLVAYVSDRTQGTPKAP